jgi:hypothetical protein
MDRMGKIVYFKSAFCWIKSKLSDYETRWQGVELLRTILIACISSSQTLFDGTSGSVCNCRKYGKSCLKLKWNGIKRKHVFPSGADTIRYAGSEKQELSRKQQIRILIALCAYIMVPNRVF